jgi:ribA/ribD-fused uncharacterized protein
MTIRFYKVNEEYGEFSNFAPFEIYVLGTTWKTSEHYFQARKFKDSEVILRIMDASTPMEAANIGRDRNNKIRDDWESIKLEVMSDAVYTKFSQHKSLLNLLLSTGEQRIIESSPYDSYWGEGKDKKGENYLGKILMEVRDRLRQESIAEIIPPWVFNSDVEPDDFYWSQGQAEDILVKWQIFFNTLTELEKKKYLNSTNAPLNWINALNFGNKNRI